MERKTKTLQRTDMNLHGFRELGFAPLASAQSKFTSSNLQVRTNSTARYRKHPQNLQLLHEQKPMKHDETCLYFDRSVMVHVWVCSRSPVPSFLSADVFWGQGERSQTGAGHRWARCHFCSFCFLSSCSSRKLRHLLLLLKLEAKCLVAKAGNDSNEQSWILCELSCCLEDLVLCDFKQKLQSGHTWTISLLVSIAAWAENAQASLVMLGVEAIICSKVFMVSWSYWYPEKLSWNVLKLKSTDFNGLASFLWSFSCLASKLKLQHAMMDDIDIWGPMVLSIQLENWGQIWTNKVEPCWTYLNLHSLNELSFQFFSYLTRGMQYAWSSVKQSPGGLNDEMTLSHIVSTPSSPLHDTDRYSIIYTIYIYNIYITYYAYVTVYTCIIYNYD